MDPIRTYLECLIKSIRTAKDPRDVFNYVGLRILMLYQEKSISREYACGCIEAAADELFITEYFRINRDSEAHKEV